jgi:hypothetical protein
MEAKFSVLRGHNVLSFSSANSGRPIFFFRNVVMRSLHQN